MTVEPIAIVGASCRLPGGANSLDSLWDLLANGGEAWSPVPADRFNETAFYHPDPNDPNGTNNHRGGHFIDGDVRDFDHAFFHISQPVAAAMDPQQRILLELVYEAFESAGWRREECAGSRTAVFAAIFGMDYERNLSKDILNLPVYQSHGTGTAILANRISHIFDLHGTSVTIDTGCSGGLVAFHQACQSLHKNESNAAVVAAANLQLMPDHYISMSNQHMINSDGRCYPFDNRGDGYGRGEGFVVVVLKRLSDALRDRDPIRSIVLNSAINQDGFTASGITHPNRIAQASLIRETYADIGLRPQDVIYVEAHGTGTVAGDNEELSAIAEVFAGPDRSLPLFVGSNKGSIGHTESTSGLASLLKAILMLEHEIIPPVAGFITPKPGLPLNKIQIPTKQFPWPITESGTPQVSINSFGYGGVNVHAIVERGPRTYSLSTKSSLPSNPRLFILSANSQALLKSTLESHEKWIGQHLETTLVDLSYTLCHRRSALSWRFSFVAEDSTSLIDGLKQGLRKLPSSSISSKRDIIFVFTGQGAQWLGMGRELLLETTPSSIFRDSIKTSGKILRELGATWDLEAELLRQDGNNEINKAELAQPATTAIQIALVALLRAQCIRPSTVVGHSSGEIAAAYAAGRISQRTAIRVAFHRGFMAAASKKRGLPEGAMLSVGLGERDVAPHLESLKNGQAVVACVNSPNSVTISGDADAVTEIMARISNREDGTFQRKLLVDTAYHSHHMQTVADEYRARIGGLDSSGEEFLREKEQNGNREVTMVSSITGLTWSSDLGTSYWIDNLVSPVRFADAIETIAHMNHQNNRGHALFIEIGPHAALAGPIRQCLAAAAPNLSRLEYDYVSALQRGVDAVKSVQILAGRLFERGVTINFDEVSALVPGFDTAVVRPDLPSHTWDHSVKHWHESRLSRDYRTRREPYHDLAGIRMTESTSIEPRWRHMVGLTTLPWLADHVIDGLMVFPGAAYVCMAAEAIMQLAREQNLEQSLETLSFHDISFLRALVVPGAPQRVELQLSLKHLPSTSPLSYAFSVAALSDGQWHEPCTGFVEGVLANKATTEGISLLPFAQQQLSRSDWTSLVPEELYAEMASNGNTYGTTFTGLRSFKMTADASVSEALVEVPDIAAIMPAQHQAPHVLHPATFDSMFHVGIPMIKQKQGAGAVMPVRIGELLISTKAPALSSPGSQLNISAKITSNHFRATHIDMTVTVGGFHVLAASAIESRSMAVVANGVGQRDICYEMTWRPDLDFLRVQDLPEHPTLIDLVEHICHKSANLSVLELGADDGELALRFLGAINAHNGTVTTYDFVDTTSKKFDTARKRLNIYPVRYRILNWDIDLESQGFTLNSYEVILISNIEFLAHASTLIKPNGLVCLVMKSGTNGNWKSVLKHECPTFDIQLTFLDSIEGSLVVLARDISRIASRLPSHIQLLSHSNLNQSQSWVRKLEVELREMWKEEKIQISYNILNHASTQSNYDVNTFTIVIDDLPQSIFADRHSFQAAIILLQQKRQILWLSLDNPSSMHQITGVGRTAHSENNDLHLTIVHATSEILQNPKLIDMISNWLGHLTDRKGEPHREREYRIRSDGAVLVPRLHSSDRLNRAIGTSEHTKWTEIEKCRFIDDARTLVLSSDGSSNKDSDIGGLFVEGQTTILDDNSVEIETEAFILSKSNGQNDCLVGEYAGVVRRVGQAVRNFASGDAVTAISLDGVVGANRPQIPHMYVSHRADSISSPTIAVALFVPSLAAIHALNELAHLSKGSAVLIHGALTDIGRAAIAVARSLGANVVITAFDNLEAEVASKQVKIPIKDIVINRSSLLRQNYNKDVRFDAIIVAEERSIPAVAWACLKPFGSIVIFQNTSSLITPTKLPRNAVVHFCHISDILHTFPQHTTDLVAQASTVFQHMPVDGVDLEIHDVAHTAEALRLIKLGVSNRVVLQVKSNSLVRAATKVQVDHSWMNSDVSYVVAGGLGDLGRRLLSLLAGRGAGHLVTLSRRKIDSDDYNALQAQLNNIRPGCRLHCLICDIKSESSVKDIAISLVEMGVPPVRGVIQSAVFLQDRTLETMTFDDFTTVTLAKIEGTLALEKVFTTPHLDFFLMLSSAVNITGASGQANYNAGNAVQDAMAHNCRPGFMSLNIGWIDDAIHIANDKTKLQGLWRTGLKPIRSSELSRYFDYILSAASRKVNLRQAIIGFDIESLSHTSSRNSNIQSALFCHVRGLSATDGTPSTTRDVQSFKDIVNSGDSENVVDFITNAIIHQLKVLISVDATQVNERDGSILDLGLDSLVAIELRNWITREFEAPLQSSEIMTDQPIRSLARKVASRSRIALSGSNAEGTSDSKETDDSIRKLSVTGILTPPESVNSSVKHVLPRLPPLPLPTLEDILKMFEESRRAVDTAHEHRETAEALQALLSEEGTALYQQIQEVGPEVIADAYERQVYLERREPLPENGPFTFIHPINAPQSSQAWRAAVITSAAIEFARCLSNGEIAPDTLHGETLTSEGRNWLFYATRLPGIGVDSMKHYSPNHTVAVLRRGHVFQLNFPSADQPINTQEVYAAYREILKATEELQPPLCTLTADERDSWALMRQELQLDPENAATLAFIDQAAFVLCLDDESPTNPRERFTQFLLNGEARPFGNRWLDKTLQLVVSVNGLSAEIYEHSKLDGLDARGLHTHILRAILSQENDPKTSTISSSSGPCAYPISKYVWNYTPNIIKRIEHVGAQCRSYGPLDYQTLDAENLSLATLRSCRSPPNATAHLTVLLALFFVDGDIRPTWEKVSLGTFARGRVEWVQTVSPATRTFIETVTGPAFRADIDDFKRARILLNEATATHARTLTAASHGRGSVGPLYALRGIAQQQQKQLPTLFKTSAWDKTRRGGPGQDVKIGFMRFFGDDDANIDANHDNNNKIHWGEAGFLVNGDRGVYIHCNVLEKHARFAIMGKPEYVSRVYEMLKRAANLVASLLET